MEPITREEKLLAGQKFQPITRKEMFLAKLAGMDVKTPEPITREEMFLKFAIENGSKAKKSKYGFYYNVPYVGDVAAGSAFVFYDDGTLIEFKGTKALLRVQSDELVTANQFVSTYTGNSLTATSASGAVFAFDENGKSFVYKDVVYTMTGLEHGVHFGYPYTSSEYGTYVFYSDGTIIYTDADGEITDYTGYYSTGWSAKQHCIGSFFISLDGVTLFVGTRIFRC